VSPLDPAARLAALMRAQVTVLRRKQPAGLQTTRQEGKAGDGDRIDVASLVAQRLKAIDPSDPQRGPKATRIYLECVMLAELGFGLTNDPAFSLMVDAVHQQMRSDPQLARALEEAATILLDSAPE
jgi:hypothetical protein